MRTQTNISEWDNTPALLFWDFYGQFIYLLLLNAKIYGRLKFFFTFAGIYYHFPNVFNVHSVHTAKGKTEMRILDEDNLNDNDNNDNDGEKLVIDEDIY